MQIISAYREGVLGDAWRSHFSERPDVQVVQHDITTLICDAVVSSANSFGFMDGGLDAGLPDRFGLKSPMHLLADNADTPGGDLGAAKGCQTRNVASTAVAVAKISECALAVVLV